MKTRRCILLLAGLGIGLAAWAQPRLPDVKDAVVEQANRFRATHGLRPLRPAPLLQRAAQDFAAYMARTDRYGHEADGRTAAQRVREAGYDYCLIAENIAYEYSSEDFATAELAQRLARGWERSPPHRANLLDGDASDTGVGLAQSRASGRYYAVQLFGRPMRQALRFELGNTSREAVTYRLAGKPYTLAPHTTRMHRVCRAPTITVQLPGRTEPQTLRPRDGQRLVVAVQADGRLGLSAR